MSLAVNTSTDARGDAERSDCETEANGVRPAPLRADKSETAPAAPAVSKAPASKGPASKTPGDPTEQRDGDATDDPKGPPSGPETDGKSRKPRRRLIFAVVGLIALIAGIGYGAYWWQVGRFLVSTDDAYVGANISQLSARVAARVAKVPVVANQRVKAGDPLVILDDTDFRLAADQATARLASQQAAITRIGKQIDAARASVVQAKAQLAAAQAEVVQADASFERTKTLARQNYSSGATLDASRATRDKAHASLAAARAGVTSAEANVAVLQSQQIEAERTAHELKVEVRKAQRDLDSTIVRAPLDGVVGNKSVQVGDYVTPGKRLAAVVPLDDVYIDANVKETQLDGIRPGQTAHVTIDAANGEAFDGTVASVAPASGSQFSLLPPDNATGNFTKIVQRIPVRIAVPRRVVEQGILRPGLSVVATIDTRTKKADAATTPPAPATRPLANSGNSANSASAN